MDERFQGITEGARDTLAQEGRKTVQWTRFHIKTVSRLAKLEPRELNLTTSSRVSQRVPVIL